MTTKYFGPDRLVWSSFSLAVIRGLTPTMVVSTCLLLVSGCAALFRPATPVLHKPLPCDLGPVLSLQLPQRIDTLAGVSRTETVVEGGVNKLTGATRGPYDIRDWFYVRREDVALRSSVEYEIIIFYSNRACEEWYASAKKDHPVFREVTENGLTARVHYTEEPRADPEGGSGPMGYYISRADFRLHNLYIRVETKARSDQGEKPQNHKLSRAVKELGQMLNKALSSGH